MMSSPELTKLLKNKEGVALMLVISAMATLSLFIGEITYTSQVNQKLAYDRLDQIKAHSLAKSGLRIALLRISAFQQVKKLMKNLTGSKGGTSGGVPGIPKSVLDKIWSEPVTLPFSGDISGLPLSVRDSISKFRKDSAMEGVLYLSITAQSDKLNLNSTLTPFAPPPPNPQPPPNPSAGNPPSTNPPPQQGDTSPPLEPADFDVETARRQLVQTIQQLFTQKFQEDTAFRDAYQNLQPQDVADDILAWSDLMFQSNRAQSQSISYKKAPFYDVSELRYLPTIDDRIYQLLSGRFTAGMTQGININSIKDSVLQMMVPQMTKEEREAFFKFRDVPPPADNTFKSGDDFFKYISENVQAIRGSESQIKEMKENLVKRGIRLVVDETDFLVRVEAKVRQTKRTLLAWVSLIEDKRQNAGQGTGTGSGSIGTSPLPSATQGFSDPNNPASRIERSNLKITQLKFL